MDNMTHPQAPGESASPKVKTSEGEGIGAHFLVRNISRIEGCARAPGWD
jgi:hypothetical protein